MTDFVVPTGKFTIGDQTRPPRLSPLGPDERFGYALIDRFGIVQAQGSLASMQECLDAWRAPEPELELTGGVFG